MKFYLLVAPLLLFIPYRFAFLILVCCVVSFSGLSESFAVNSRSSCTCRPPMTEEYLLIKRDIFYIWSFLWYLGTGFVYFLIAALISFSGFLMALISSL